MQNYNVSYAEKLIPAAEVSEQISTAGTEASGTGNMKFMLNGAVTLGTYDGANIEIVERGRGGEQLYLRRAGGGYRRCGRRYDPSKLYDADTRVRRVLDTLVDGTLSDGGTGMFRELYDALLEGASWHRPDQYFLLLDFIPYCETRLRANRDYADRRAFAKKCLLNIANAGQFSSDRTIRQYAREIWCVRGGLKRRVCFLRPAAPSVGSWSICSCRHRASSSLPGMAAPCEKCASAFDNGCPHLWPEPVYLIPFSPTTVFRK